MLLKRTNTAKISTNAGVCQRAYNSAVCEHSRMKKYVTHIYTLC